MNHPLLIGISGKAQSGKGVFTSECLKLLRARDITCVEYSFAYPLKKCVKYLFDLSDKDVNTSKGKEKILDHFNGITVREILQKFGTEVGRNIYKDIWIWHLIERIKKSNKQVIIISDMRFENEYKIIKKHGGLVIRTERIDYNIKENNHASETGLDHINKWDYICNASSIEEIKNIANRFIIMLFNYLEFMK